MTHHYNPLELAPLNIRNGKGHLGIYHQTFLPQTNLCGVSPLLPIRFYQILSQPKDPFSPCCQDIYKRYVSCSHSQFWLVSLMHALKSAG